MCRYVDVEETDSMRFIKAMAAQPGPHMYNFTPMPLSEDFGSALEQALEMENTGGG